MIFLPTEARTYVVFCDYSFGVFWPLRCLSFDLRLLITLLVSCVQCVVCPVIYGFWLLLWCLLVIVLSILRFTASGYSFGVLWSLCCLSFDLRLLITPLVSFGHCIVCPSIYGFWLLLWCLLAIALSVLWLTASDHSFGVLCSVCCLSCDLRLLLIPLVSCGQCGVCPVIIYGFWLLLWWLVVSVLSVLWFTASDYSFGVCGQCVACPVNYAFDYSFDVFWSVCFLSCELRLLVTPLVSCGHCVVCPVIYGFWLLLWYLVVIVLSVLWFTASYYSDDVFWSLYFLSFDLRLLITPLVSFGHCVVCPVIYGFWLLLWYLVVIVLSVLWFTASGYSFGVFWSLWCLSCDLRFLVTPLVSCGHCVVCPVIYGFWLLLWCLLVIVLSVLWFTASGYSFGVLWSLWCLSCDLRLLVTPLVSCGHCDVCPVIYGFWLLLCCLVVIVLSVLWFTASVTPLVSFSHCVVCPVIYGFLLLRWCLLVIVLSVLWFTASDYSFGVFWSLCCLSCDLRLLVTPMVSCGHCVVCPVIYGFWLLLWCLLVIVMSVLWFTVSDYSFGVFWSLCCLSCDLLLLITPLVSCGHCVVCPVTYGFWLLLWCLVVIVLSVLWFTVSDCSFGVFWSLCCLSCDLLLLITPLVSCGHCVVCPLIYGFWLLLWCLVVIVLSVLWFTASDYSFGVFWSLCCLSCDLRLLITPLVSCGHWVVCPVIYSFWLLRWCLLVIVLSVLWFTASDYSFGVFWSLCCLSCDLRLLVTPMVSCGHCVVCPVIYGFWLLLWCLLVIVLSVLWFTASDYSFGILWSLWCLSCDLRLLITPLVSCGHCVVCPVIYGFWLLLWYLVVIVLSPVNYGFWLLFWCLVFSVLSVLWFTASDYSFGILWSLWCLSCDLRFLITPLVSCGHCVVCPVIYGFWLLLWCLLVIVLSVLWFTVSDYSFGVFWSLCCLSCDLRLLITPLVSCGHCVVSCELRLLVTLVVPCVQCVICHVIYGFWWLLWCLVVSVVSVLWLFTLLITPLVSCGHCVVCPVIYGFRLLLCCLVVIVLSVLWFTASDYSFAVLWSLCCLSCNLRFLITPLVSFGHCVVCPVIYGFWLLLWYLVVIVLSVLWFTLLITPLMSFGHFVVCPVIYSFWLLRWCLLVSVLSVLWFTASDYSYGILWSLCCLSCDLRLLITPLVSCGHCVICPVIYRFWLLRWCLLVIVLSVLWFTLLITPLVSCGHCVVCPVIYGFWLLLCCLVVIVLSVLWFTASDYSFGILWSLCCLSCDLRFWLLRWCLLVILLSVLWFTASGYSVGVLWSLWCLSCDLRLLITPLVSCGHCVVCPLMNGFWLLLWCLLGIVLSVLWFMASDYSIGILWSLSCLLWITASGYSFGVFWSLCCLAFDLRLLITPLVSCGHWVVCPFIYCLWLLLWCLLVIVLSVLWFTASDYSFGILWLLSCLSFDLRLLITPLVSCAHWVVCPLIYGFWLLPWCLVVIEFSVLWFTASDYFVGVFWSLCCLSCDLRLLITPLVSFGHCVVCPVIYGFWLLLWCLVVIVLSVLWFTASGYSFGIFWSLCCLSCDLRLLITPLCLLVIELSVLWFTASGYSFGFLWSLSGLSCDLRLLITRLVSCSHWVVCPWIYGFRYSFGIYLSLSCLSFDLRFLITPLVSCGHWVVCPLIYGFWLLLWCLVVIVLSVLWFTASDYSFGVFWSLYCLSFDLRLLITPLMSCGHWVVCPLTYGFWLLLWCLVIIELSVLWFAASDYSFGVLWSLCCLSFDLRLLITPLVSCGHCVVCPLIYGFWLLLWCFRNVLTPIGQFIVTPN